MRTTARASATRVRSSSFGTRRLRSPKAMLSATVMCGKSAYCWNTVLTSRR
jgi:hypothetical protein